MHRRSRFAPWLALLLVLGCKRETIRAVGLTPTEDAARPPPGVWAPVDPSDLDAVALRGRMIARLDRAVAVALSAVGEARAAGKDAILLPVPTLDRTLRVAEVRFVRFDAPPSGPEDVARATVHAMVGVLLPAERILQVELVGKPLDPATPLGWSVEAILASSRALAGRQRGTFRFFPVPERVPTDDNRFGYTDQVRVHALAARAEGTDFDLLVRPPERRAPAEVVTVSEADRFDLALRQVDVPAPLPTPSAVARAAALLAEGLAEVTRRGAAGSEPALP